jgi:hypothetical protein
LTVCFIALGNPTLRIYFANNALCYNTITSVSNKQGRYDCQNKNYTDKQCSFGTNCTLVFITNVFWKHCVYRHCETKRRWVSAANYGSVTCVSMSKFLRDFHSILDLFIFQQFYLCNFQLLWKKMTSLIRAWIQFSGVK